MKKHKFLTLTLLTVALTLGLTSAAACEGTPLESGSQSSESVFSMGGTQSSESELFVDGAQSSESELSIDGAQSSEGELSIDGAQSSEDIFSMNSIQTSEIIFSDFNPPSSEESSFPESSDNEHVHAWGEWILVSEPSCEEQGEQFRICLLDGSHVEREYFEPLGHNTVGYGAKEPTCSEVGWKDYEACLNCSYSTYVELPATGEHDVTEAEWRSTDNVTMTASCKNCNEEITQEVPACDHFLTLDVQIGIYGEVNSKGEYTCVYCGLKFDPYNVLTLTFSDAEDEGYYRMEISSKIATAEYDYYGILFKPLEVKIENGCSFTYETSWEENKQKIREIVFGENITVVGKIDYYEYAYTVIFSEQVEKIKTDSTCDLFSLREIYFEGDLPELEPDALWRRGAVVEGEAAAPFSPIVYYKNGAKGFENYGYKLQGCGLRMIEEEIAGVPAWTMTEYAAKTNARSLEMAAELFEKAAKTRPYLQFYPFCDLSKYKPIKDLALSLTEGLSTDREKAKAIFDWIVANLTYDEGAMYYPVEKVFEERKAVCAGYAGLLHDMLAAVKIPSIYTAGISYFGTGCTVQDVLNNEENFKYAGNGHGWMICLLDGEPLICDATWGNFAFTAEELTEACLATTRINGISVIPKEADPAWYESLLYYDDGEVYYLSDGYLDDSNMYSIIINWVYQFDYEFRAGNDGYHYGKGILDCQSAYSDLLICYGEHDYKFFFFFGADYLRYNYVEILKFIAFEKLYYGNENEIDLMEEFMFDENGTIYHINENELSVAASVSQADSLVIPETVNGLTVTAIDDNALTGCYAKEIILPDSIETIGAQAFMGCENLESIVLPKNLKHIEPGVFAFCWNLKSVTMYTDVEFIGYKNNSSLCIPSLLFDEIPVEQLTVYYEGTEEQFNEIFFNDPFTNPEELTFDTAQYEHVKGYVTFKE